VDGKPMRRAALRDVEALVEEGSAAVDAEARGDGV
jgi:hypothetical protein